MEVQDVEAPMLIAKHCSSDECLLLRPFKAPTVVNIKDIEAGETLTMAGKPNPSIANFLCSSKKKGEAIVTNSVASEGDAVPDATSAQ